MNDDDEITPAVDDAKNTIMATQNAVDAVPQGISYLERGMSRTTSPTRSRPRLRSAETARHYASVAAYKGEASYPELRTMHERVNDAFMSISAASAEVELDHDPRLQAAAASLQPGAPVRPASPTRP